MRGRMAVCRPGIPGHVRCSILNPSLRDFQCPSQIGLLYPRQNHILRPCLSTSRLP